MQNLASVVASFPQLFLYPTSFPTQILILELQDRKKASLFQARSLIFLGKKIDVKRSKITQEL